MRAFTTCVSLKTNKSPELMRLVQGFEDAVDGF